MKTVGANVPYRFDSSNWKLKKKNKELVSFKMHKNADFVKGLESALKAKNYSKEGHGNHLKYISGLCTTRLTSTLNF